MTPLEENVEYIKNSRLVRRLLSRLELEGKSDLRTLCQKAVKPIADEAIFSILHELEDELDKRIVGQRELLRVIMIALVLNQHALLEGLPGVGKTEIVKQVAHLIGMPYSRVQFIPDMLPSDLIGKDSIDIVKLESSDMREKRDAVNWVNGPVFAGLVLADELNRAPAKVQAALLEAMGEHQATPFGKSARPLFSALHKAALDCVLTQTDLRDRGLLDVPKPIRPETRHSFFAPFVVLATMNPIEQEGVYPLSEAQVDRFLFKTIVPYPGRDFYDPIQKSVMYGKRADAPAANMLARECEAYFKEHPGDAVIVLLPLYFFLICRARLTPLAIDDATICEEHMYGRMNQSEEGRRWLSKVNDIIYMTNARTERSGDTASGSHWYDREQVEMRRYIHTHGREDMANVLAQEHTQYVRSGASPRGFLSLVPAAMCHAMLEGRTIPNYADLQAVIDNVLRHRIHMDVRAQLAGISAEDVIHRVSEILLTA